MPRPCLPGPLCVLLLLVPVASAQKDPGPPLGGQPGLLTDRPDPRPLTLPDDDPAFLFAVFGDRTGGPPEGVQVLAQAVDEVNLIAPDLVLTVGDLIQGYGEADAWLTEMEEYTGIMDRLEAPWFPVAGNHDVYWRGQGTPPPGQHEALYEEHFGPLWYAFEHKGAWFIVLYTDEGNPATGEMTFRDPAAQRMSREQFAWLSRVLERAAEAPHVFVFLHHPRWLGGNYGDDWDKVHQLLVDAGNVSAVFAGHIHRMRYDPRDGIEYFTLATVGGHQAGYVPEAGWLHHYELVMVRDDRIAVASYPVGSADDPRALTAEVVDTSLALASGFGVEQDGALTAGSDGSVDAELVLRLVNPVEHPVEVSLSWPTGDGWTARPEHLHTRLEAGASLSVPCRVRRPADGRPSAPAVDLSLALLTDSVRVPLPVRRHELDFEPGLRSPPRPEHEHALAFNGSDDRLVVPDARLALPDGPLTVECRVAPRSLDGQRGLVSKTESSEFGLYLTDGVPGFWLHLDGGYRVVQAPDHRLAEAAWYHLAAVFDGHDVRLYVDGELAAEAPASGARTPNGLALQVGCDVRSDGSGAQWFDGWIDEVRVSSRARYSGPRFTPPRRLVADEHTRLLLHADAELGDWVFDDSPAAAHPRRHGARVELVR